MVVPYGPLGPYFRIAELVNKYRISIASLLEVSAILCPDVLLRTLLTLAITFLIVYGLVI